MDFSSWANRRSGRANQEPQQARQPAPVVPRGQVAGAPQPTLPPAPAGFAWSFMSGQFVLVPLAQPQVFMQPAQQTIIAPVRQPMGVVPYVQPHMGQPAGAPPRMVETCQLVKPGNRDTYAEMLNGLPELVPDQGFDIEAGNPNPAVQAELRGFSEYHTGADAPNPDAPLRSFTGGQPLIQGSAPLKGASA